MAKASSWRSKIESSNHQNLWGKDFLSRDVSDICAARVTWHAVLTVKKKTFCVVLESNMSNFIVFVALIFSALTVETLGNDPVPVVLWHGMGEPIPCQFLGRAADVSHPAIVVVLGLDRAPAHPNPKVLPTCWATAPIMGAFHHRLCQTDTLKPVYRSPPLSRTGIPGRSTRQIYRLSLRHEWKKKKKKN